MEWRVLKNKQQSTQYEVDSMKSDLKYKVDKSDLKDLRELIEKRYATLEECKAVDLRFNDYSTLSNLREVEQILLKFQTYVETTYIPEVDTNNRIQELKEEIYNNFSQKESVKSMI